MSSVYKCDSLDFEMIFMVASFIIALFVVYWIIYLLTYYVVGRISSIVSIIQKYHCSRWKKLLLMYCVKGMHNIIKIQKILIWVYRIIWAVKVNAVYSIFCTSLSFFKYSYYFFHFYLFSSYLYLYSCTKINFRYES